MKTFPLIISTPDGEIFNDSAVNISVRGVEGELAVMAGHIPFVTAVKPGRCTVELEDGSIKEAAIEGGILTVSSDNVRVLAGSFTWK